MNSIQKIEQAVYAIRPELKELSFGCRVNYANWGIENGIYIGWSCDEQGYIIQGRQGTYTLLDKDIGGVESLGHPITLSDILLLFAKSKIQPKYIHGYNDDELLICLPFTDERKLNCVYNLRLSPYEQSEEVKDFIANMTTTLTFTKPE